LPVPAAVVGRRGVVFHANRAFLAHFGSPLEPLPKALGLESAQWDRLITAGSLTLPDGRSLSTVPLGTRRFLLTLGDDGRLEGLNQLAIALCRDLTVDPIWVIGPRLVEVAGADQVVLWVRRSLAGDFEGYAWPPEAPGRIPYLGITDLDELERDPTASAWLGQFLRWSGYGAYWLRPLRVDWDRLGLLVVGRFTNRPFSAEEQARLEVAAGLITLAWHRRLLTDRLARNLAELNAFWQVANVGLVLVDAEGRVVAANPAAQELASGAGANVAGRLCRDVFPLVDDSGEPVCGRHCPLADLRNDERAAVRAYIPVPGGAPAGGAVDGGAYPGQLWAASGLGGGYPGYRAPSRRGRSSDGLYLGHLPRAAHPGGHRKRLRCFPRAAPGQSAGPGIAGGP